MNHFNHDIAMKYILLSSTLILASLFSYGADNYDNRSLRELAAGMLMVGFKGDTITADNPVIGYLTRDKVGGIILFDVDLTGTKKLGSRNITSRSQLKNLTSSLNAIADYPLLIAADQEGGRVQRLKPQYGYTAIPSAHRLGQIADIDSTRFYGNIIASELRESGVNVNLAPELDLHNDSCPVIGRLDRAYSCNPDSVTLHAEATIDCMHNHGIAVALKHFPGHGSANSDSHYGLTDVTSTWSDKELKPFADIIDAGKADMIMTAHIFNRQLDQELPATLSRRILTEILRDSLGFEGVILTDDMYMQGIIDNYSIEEAIITAINAGADMFIMGNNITTGFEADRPSKVVDIIVNAVENGKIPRERLIESNRRIDLLKSKIAAGKTE